MITEKIGVKVYFADPYSSWQKGAIENANGLVRLYIQKTAQFSSISHQKIKQIVEKIKRKTKGKTEFPNSKRVLL